MKLYVAGPMTGLPNMNFPAFEEAARRLRKFGHSVVSPHELGKSEDTWHNYMKQDIVLLLKCEGVAMLPNWQMSRGARLEVFIARSLDMETKIVSNWL